jgi:hypothetical protein
MMKARGEEEEKLPKKCEAQEWMDEALRMGAALGIGWQ